MIPLDIYIPFVMFVIVMTGTPGMGNLSMMAIGQTSGFRSSLPFLLGTTMGAMTLDTLVGLGLGGLFTTSHIAAWAMKIIGSGYICYLGWKLLRMQLSDAGIKRRLSLVDGLFLHPLNPKSWAMAVVGFSMLIDPAAPLLRQVIIYVLTFAFFQVSFHSLWGLAGVAIMRTLKSGPVLAGVNCVLVAVMVGATLYAVFV